jgi:osmotically-inducible protein OsmY
VQRHFRLIAVVLASLAAAVAQQSKAPARGPAKAPISDLELEKAIRARFASSKSGADKFTVKVQGGVATLEGKTDVVQRKAAATRMAKTAGAKEVVNKIEVSQSARQKASQNLATGRRRAQVKRSEAPR